MQTQEALQRTYTTDSDGNELPITAERNPNAAIHFTQVGRIPDGTVWRCDTIHGRSLTHRLTFSSYYAKASGTAHTMGWLLFCQMLALEATAKWELELEQQHAKAA